MNILITNVYCFMNKGDAGILRSTINLLKKQYPNSKISVLSLYPEMDQNKYGEDIEVLSAPIKPVLGKKKVIINLVKLAGILTRVITGVLDNTLKTVKNADLIICCGGGFFKSVNLYQFFGDNFYHYVQMLCCILLGKEYTIFAQTVGYFGRGTVQLNKFVMERAKKILLREEISLKYMKTICLKNPNTYLTSDMAFLLSSRSIECLKLSDRFRVGITIRSWNFPNLTKQERNQRIANYKKTMAEFIDYLAGECNCHVYLMPQSIGPHTDNDIEISREILNKVNNRSEVSLIEEDYWPEELKYFYSKMDVFIGTRMHSNIFALAEGVPCMAISYDHKTEGIMQQFALSRYVVRIEEINLDTLKSLFVELKGQRRLISRNISLKMEMIKKQSLMNARYAFQEE